LTAQAPPVQPHRWPAEDLRRAVEAAGIALWTWDVDDDSFTMDEQGFKLWGLPWKQRTTFGELSAHIHPPTGTGSVPPLRRPARWSAATRPTSASSWAMKYDGSPRAAAGGCRHRRPDDVWDFPGRNRRKQAEEGHELLAGEMSHRVKNLLAIAAGLTQITSRSTQTPAEMAQELTSASPLWAGPHDLVRPLPGGQGSAALLGDLLSVLLAPYDDLGAFSGRIRVAVERMGVGMAAATSLALVIHELATNSLKYGALSSGAGTLDVSTTPNDSSWS
jgi:two-component sensor histidine kinase